MKSIRILLSVIIFAGVSLVLSASREHAFAPAQPQKVRIQIQVVADSSNSLLAQLEVPVGTPARDLMDRLFKMNYVDFTHRFVNGIAGFTVTSREKKFWKLEIDGKASDVGIAEIKISQPMQIRWVMTEYK